MKPISMVPSISSQFPLLNQSDLVYLDNSSTTQKPEMVLQRLNEFYRNENANVHRSLYPLGDKATIAYEEARRVAADFLNAHSDREIIFTTGTTGGLNLLASSFCSTLKRGDRILLTEMEHHSNLVPWQLSAEQYGLKLDFIPVTPEGTLNLDVLTTLWHKKTRLISLTHLSNLLGTINPIKEIIREAHERGIPVAIDAAQSAAHVPLNVEELDCDFLAFSGHKVYGPTGIGILYGKEELLEKLPPWQGGGDMISSVSLQQSSWNQLPWKFEAGTPNIAGAIGLGAALEWMKKQDPIQFHQRELTDRAIEELKAIRELDLYGPGDHRQLGVISFNIRGIHGHDSVQLLSSKGIALRAGHHCAQPLIRKLGIASTVRASFALYNSIEDIYRLTGALRESIDFFKEKGML